MIGWALRQVYIISNYAKAMKVIADDGASGQQREDNLMARFDFEPVPDGWCSVLRQ